MAGHSKWANIKHRKEKSDKQKGKIFSQLAKEIITSVKVGGPDPQANPRLRLAIQKAKTANFPNDNIERNIKKASSGQAENFESVTYELYGFEGVGLFVEATTDNKNRTASEIRIAINKRGGTLATPGSVSFNFDRKGVILVTRKSQSEEEMVLRSLEAGAEDLESTPEGYLIITDPASLFAVKDKLEKEGIMADEAGFEMVPKGLIACSEEAKKDNLALIEWLEDIDDVTHVFHTMEITS